jgi:hypothetical protein
MIQISETLINLLSHCPCGKPSESCIFNALREMDKKEQITHIINLETDEKVLLLKEHKYCLVIRETNQDFEIIDLAEFQDFI